MIKSVRIIIICAAINIFSIFVLGYGAEPVARDPFSSQLPAKKPPKKEEPPPKDIPKPTLLLQGLVWQTSMPQAIVNNKVIKAGDRLSEDIKVLDVSKEGITIEYQGAAFFYSSDLLVPKKDEKLELKQQKKGL